MMISSEESGNEDGEKILTRKTIRYRSQKVDDFFLKLDGLAKESRSVGTARPTLPRKEGQLSSRALPDNHGLPSWALNLRK